MIKLKKRFSAVLMSISSLPSPFGIGDFGKGAKDFLKLLSEMGFSAWQVLPFNPLDFGNSPYGSHSAFAGNYLYIDPIYLYKKNYISNEELQNAKYIGSPYTVDYSAVKKSKFKILKAAFENAKADLLPELQTFMQENDWVRDYALYMSIKETNGMLPFTEWDNELKNYNSALKHENEYKDKMLFYAFEQYIFSLQYNELKKYAEDLKIAIIGDIPIYVAPDSVDVWKNPELFDLNDDYSPRKVAGVPPDAFSSDGQLWGNPVYLWKNHISTDFEWWMSRLKRTFELYDVVRIDHFRGFSSYYSVDADAENAVHGNWEFAPGSELFKKVLSEIDKERIIAEDLGTLSADVTALLNETEIRGMRVIQFGFADGNSMHLPHNYAENCVAYIGTHDNNTLLGWLWELNDTDRKNALDYCGFKDGNWGDGGYYSKSCRAVIETVWKSSAAGAVIPFQDLCGYGCDARMNIPGVADNNWRFRTTEDVFGEIDKKYYKKINELYFR